MAEATPGAEPSQDQIAALTGPVLLEFGTSWCGHCAAAQPLIAAALDGHPRVRRIKVEDGPGRRLGRQFRVKLWPTLVFLRDGQEQVRLVRPQDMESIVRALTDLGTAP